MTAPVVTPSTRYLVDLVERTVFTYAEAFLGLLIADQTNFTAVSKLLNGGRAAALAAIPAGLAVAKGLIAKLVGNPDSASLATTIE